MNKTKRLISIFLSLIMLLSITAGLSISVNAEQSGDFEYAVLSDGTAEITGYTGSAAELIIPSEIDGYTVTSIGEMAFYNYEQLKSVKIPGSVNTINRSAFGFCIHLSDVVIEDGVQYIGDRVFYLCSLRSIIIPKSVTKMGYLVFDYNYGLKSIIILNPDCEIGNIGAFVGAGNNEETIGVTIYGYEGSTAQEYAENNDWRQPKFVVINENMIIADGTDTEYTIGSEKGATIHCAYPLEDFISVSVNGEIVDSSNYTLQEGSTILTFLPSYLDTLAPGEYEVVLSFVNGTASSTLTVIGATDSDEPADETSSTAQSSASKKSPSTGAPTALAAFAAAFAAGGLAVLVKKKAEK